MYRISHTWRYYSLDCTHRHTQTHTHRASNGGAAASSRLFRIALNGIFPAFLASTVFCMYFLHSPPSHSGRDTCVREQDSRPERRRQSRSLSGLNECQLVYVSRCEEKRAPKLGIPRRTGNIKPTIRQPTSVSLHSSGCFCGKHLASSASRLVLPATHTHTHRVYYTICIAYDQNTRFRPTIFRVSVCLRVLWAFSTFSVSILLSSISSEL